MVYKNSAEIIIIGGEDSDKILVLSKGIFL